MSASIDRLAGCATRVKEDRFTDVVLLGMGGSSLAPEVLRAIVGVSPGYPRLHMLDSTDPEAILAVSSDPRTTLYVLASKSGTTIEPNSLAAYFRQQLENAHVPSWSAHFIAITDEGTELAKRAQADGFRDLFINPSDIGGRYSALSFFGLVPAALMGQNIRAIVDHGLAMLAASDPARGNLSENPAGLLGLAIGTAARAGRDKLTLLLPPPLQPFGLWVEQLIAESTGKRGTGVIPVAGEPVAETYGDDRLFVAISSETDRAPVLPAGVGAPMVSIELPTVEMIGAEFVRWEIATAVAGAILEINPFDEPNVQQAKDATKTLLDGFEKSGALPAPPVTQTLAGGVALTLSSAASKALGARDAAAFLTMIGPHDYFGLLAYVGPDAAFASVLRDFRASVLNRTCAATMFGYGPRYLHSTGQLHKGGPNSGVFVLVSATPSHDLPIPSQAFSFGTLEFAQALGDFSSLDATGRRAVHIHLPAPDSNALRLAFDTLLGALS
jgi:glucose-6-phosphate isomerase